MERKKKIFQNQTGREQARVAVVIPHVAVAISKKNTTWQRKDYKHSRAITLQVLRIMNDQGKRAFRFLFFCERLDTERDREDMTAPLEKCTRQEKKRLEVNDKSQVRNKKV